MDAITIKMLHTPAQMDAAVELQKVYWGEDMGDLVPSHMLLSIVRYGGHVHGAFDGDKMVGMLLGFVGADIEPESEQDAPSRMLIMSKRMVVLPAYRGQKIGENLKLAQADYARRHGIQLVTWTFDPVLSRNAYLNLHKLGGVGQYYVQDYFGKAADNPVLSADRLVVNWWVDRQFSRPESYEDYAIVNEIRQNEQGLLVPGDIHIGSADVLALELPMEFVALQNINPELGHRWRMHVRDAFQALLHAGYVVTDFMRQKSAATRTFAQARDSVYYIFTRDTGHYTFR